MDLIADRGRRVTIEELNTSRLLAHARKQAVQRKFDDMLIVDVDAHHYENEHFGEILPFMENEVLKQLALFCGAGLLVSLLMMTYGLDLGAVKWVTFEDAHVAEYRDPPGVTRAWRSA